MTAVRNIDVDTVAEAIGGLLEGILDLGLAFFENDEDWAYVGAKLGQIIGKIPWMDILIKAIKLIAAAWGAVNTMFWMFMASIQASITTWIEEKMNGLKNKIAKLMEIGLKVVLLEGLKILGYLVEIWEKIKTWWNENITPKLKLEYWTDKLKPIKNAITGVFKGAANLVIDIMNGMIAKVENAFNTIVRKVNSLSIVNPFNGEEIWSPNIPLFSFGRIPRLARGGIVARPTQAIIGEAGKEAVMPLENNTEWMDILADKINGANNNITIRFTGSTAQLVRLLKPELEKEDKRTGRRLIVGGAY